MSVRNIGLMCANAAGEGGLKYHSTQFGVGGLSNILTFNCPIGLDLNEVWNGLKVSNICCIDRSGRDGVKYGIYSRDNTNNIEFEDINVQKLSDGSGQTTAMRLEQCDNSSLRNFTFKGAMNGIDFLQDPNSTTKHRAGGGLGFRADGGYFEPNDSESARENVPEDYFLFRLRSADPKDPIRKHEFNSIKCGWGHGDVGKLTFFDLKNVESMTVSNCTLKGIISGGEVVHVSTEGTNRNNVFEDTNTITPGLGTIAKPELIIEGDASGIIVQRPEMFIPAADFSGDLAPEWIDTGSGMLQAIVFPQSGSSTVRAQIGLPAEFNKGQHTIVELRYCTATPAAGEVARFNVQTRGIDVGQLMTNATAGSTADVEPSEVAYQLSSTAKAEWDAGDVNQGLIIVDIERAANKAADTLNQDVFLTGIRIYQVFERYDTEGTQVYW